MEPTVYRVNNRDVTEAEFRKYDLLNNDIKTLENELRKGIEAYYEMKIRSLEHVISVQDKDLEAIRDIILGDGYDD